jgi:hypothetical protein
MLSGTVVLSKVDTQQQQAIAVVDLSDLQVPFDVIYRKPHADDDKNKDKPWMTTDLTELDEIRRRLRPEDYQQYANFIFQNKYDDAERLLRPNADAAWCGNFSFTRAEVFVSSITMKLRNLDASTSRLILDTIHAPLGTLLLAIVTRKVRELLHNPVPHVYATTWLVAAECRSNKPPADRPSVQPPTPAMPVFCSLFQVRHVNAPLGLKFAKAVASAIHATASEVWVTPPTSYKFLFLSPNHPLEYERALGRRGGQPDEGWLTTFTKTLKQHWSKLDFSFTNLDASPQEQCYFVLLSFGKEFHSLCANLCRDAFLATACFGDAQMCNNFSMPPFKPFTDD